MTDRWRTDLIVEAGSATLDDLWDVFIRSLDHLRERSPIKQVVSRAQFDEMFADPRIIRVALRDIQADDRLVGLTLVSNDLSALPEPSADYFRARWPEHYAAGRVWYVSYVVVIPEYVGTSAGASMIGFCLDLVSEEQGGVFGLDVCETNEERVQFARSVPRIADRLFRKRLEGHRLDSQLFFAYEVPPTDAG